MKFFLAPMQGLTGYTVRNAFHHHFDYIDKYYTPFIPAAKRMNAKIKRDIDPVNNDGITLIPQAMSIVADEVIDLHRQLVPYGYDEINVNLGCPSGTVVSKKRGSGILAYPDMLDSFLDELYTKADFPVSIKTRVGFNDDELWPRLIEIYSKYPISELTVHPRVQKDFYKNQPNLCAFHDAVEEIKIPLCYNGDIFTPESYEEMKREFPQVDTFMLGRGILMNPALLDLIRMREKTDVKKTTDIDVTEWKKEETLRKMQSADRYKKEIHAFLEQIKCDYLEVGMGEKNTLFKLKELWAYMGQNAPEAKKALKRIRKSQSMADYDSASREALEDFILF